MMYSDAYNSSTMSRPGGNDSALNTVLTQYSRTAVKTRFQEQDKSHKIAQPVVNQILQEMKRSGGLFLQESVLVESHFQGQSIGKEDYLTFGVPMAGFDRPLSRGSGSGGSTGRYYKLTYTTDKAGHSVVHLKTDGFISGNRTPMPSVTTRCRDVRGACINEEAMETDEHIYPQSCHQADKRGTEMKAEQGVLLNATIVKSSVPLPPSPTGYTIITGGSYKDHQPNLCFDGDIIPVLNRRKLKENLTSTIERLGLQGQVTLNLWRRGHAVTFRIKDPHHHSITVELVPMINAPTDRWISDTTWPKSGSRWPASRKVDRIKGIGYRHLATKDFDWERAYMLCEDELMKDIDSDGGCRGEVYQVLQKLNEAFWCDASKNLLSSHMLKNLLFWECDRYPNSPDWSPSHLATRVISMTSQLHEQVGKLNLPLFMNPEVNLLADRKVNQAQELVAVANKIREFLEFAVGKLQLAMGACAAFAFE